MQRSGRHLIVLLSLLVAAMPSVTRGAECPAVTVGFTPGEHCTDAIVQALGAARRTVPAQA